MVTAETNPVNSQLKISAILWPLYAGGKKNKSTLTRWKGILTFDSGSLWTIICVLEACEQSARLVKGSPLMRTPVTWLASCSKAVFLMCPVRRCHHCAVRSRSGLGFRNEAPKDPSVVRIGAYCSIYCSYFMSNLQIVIILDWGP